MGEGSDASEQTLRGISVNALKNELTRVSPVEGLKWYAKIW
ncbi:MAG: hypothetical protein Q8L37_03115 [Candidatus Gottesmanbacteria bacterium]|nr:hypothetical protein [Candidatus Gottesmanbacteria bacterium]